MTGSGRGRRHGRGEMRERERGRGHGRGEMRGRERGRGAMRMHWLVQALAELIPYVRTHARVRVLVMVLLAACSAPAEPISQPELMPDPSPFKYPVSLWDQRVNGETVLMLHVTREGVVDSVSVFNSSGQTEFDSAAVTGARQLRFIPGRRGARPVDMWTKLPVRFWRDSTSVTG